MIALTMEKMKWWIIYILITQPVWVFLIEMFPSRDNGWTECLNNDQWRIIYAESRNRKLLEQLEEQKKRLRGVHTAGGAGAAAPSTSSVASSSRWAALSTCRYTAYTKHTLHTCTWDGCMLGCALTVTYAHACMDTHTHTHARTLSWTYLQTHIHAHTHIYMQTHMYAHMHAHTQSCYLGRGGGEGGLLYYLLLWSDD